MSGDIAGIRTAYVETSSLLAAVLNEDPAARRELGITERRVTSELTIAEARRAVTRDRLSERIDERQERAVLAAIDAFIDSCDVSAVTTEILLRAGRKFAVEPVRTLDAIHLATLESMGIPPQLVLVITRDRRVRDNAVAMGYRVN